MHHLSGLFTCSVLSLMAIMLCGGSACAENACREVKTSLTYDVCAEMAVGTGDYTAYQLATNRHHVLATRANTGYVRGAVNMTQWLGERWMLSACFDAVAAVHADHSVYLQQCYARVSNSRFFLEAGCHEEGQVVREDTLSVGSFVKGTNAKPVPQVRVGTEGFLTVPGTGGWIQVNVEAGYGKFMDSDYRQEVMMGSAGVNTAYTTGAYYHQKHLYIRSNPRKRFFAMVGIEHAVQFGGTRISFENGVMSVKKKPANANAFLNVVLPLGDSRYFENNAYEDWVYGNHVGVMTYQVGWNITPRHCVQAYLDNPFEDGSGVRKGNGWDGLWGLHYSNTAPGTQLVRAAVVEYFQSTNQSGPLHWDSDDYAEPIRSSVNEYLTGGDNYYNHQFYGGYSYYGMTPGIALITSPRYNVDGYDGFRDSRVKAWHAGVRGELSPHLSYMLKGSYREGWGTYDVPLACKHHSFDMMMQGGYACGAWSFNAAWAQSSGNIYGDCSTFNIKIGYHGRIF